MEGGSDFAIIRFKIGGLDDLTQLPRVFAVLGVALIIANHVFFPEPPGVGQQVGVGAFGDPRLFVEALAAALAAACLFIPNVGARLEEAGRRQISSRSQSRAAGCLQTLAINASLTPSAKLDLSWTTSALLRLTNADGLVIVKGDGAEGSPVCTRGLLKQLGGFKGGPEAVLQALGRAWRPSAAPVDGYCSSGKGISAFPAGAVPTAVIPGDAESVMVKPLPGGGRLVLWSALPRAFDRAADRAWVGQAAAKLGIALNGSAAAAEAASVREQCFEDDLPLIGGGDDLAEADSSDPFSRYDQAVRIAPGVVGLLALSILGYNRIALVGNLGLGIDPAQSRADLICGVLATTLVLQGVTWLSETPATPKVEDTSKWEKVVDVEGAALEGEAADELRWAWGTLSRCTRVSSMAVFWKGGVAFQGGLFQEAEGGGPKKPELGALCQEVMSSGKGRYMAQMKNYPAKEQFLNWMPALTQGMVISPLRPAQDAPAQGVLVLGVDSVRGIGRVDQAWIGALAEKLAVSLDQAR